MCVVARSPRNALGAADIVFVAGTVGVAGMRILVASSSLDSVDRRGLIVCIAGTASSATIM